MRRPDVECGAPGGQACADGVQLHLGDRALEAQEQPPVGRGRVVDAFTVADKALSVAAQVEQRVPVRAVAAEAGHLGGEHDADLTQRDARDQVLEARPVHGRRPAQAEVAVDHLDILLAPTEVERAPAQVRLEHWPLWGISAAPLVIKLGQDRERSPWTALRDLIGEILFAWLHAICTPLLLLGPLHPGAPGHPLDPVRSL